MTPSLETLGMCRGVVLGLDATWLLPLDEAHEKMSEHE
jgi:hypothetical protein